MTGWAAAWITLGALSLMAGSMIRRGRRMRARRRARWQGEHARRLPWTLFLRRRAPLRLTDERPARPDPGDRNA